MKFGKLHKTPVVKIFLCCVVFFFTNIWTLCSFGKEKKDDQNANPAQQEILSYYKNFFPNLWFGTVSMPNTQNFLVLLFGSLATTVAIFRFDNNIKNFVIDHPNFMGRWADIGNNEWTSSLLGVAIGLIDIGYGWGTKTVYNVHAGEAQLESAVATALYTNLIKVSVGRERPTSHSKTSFPSGHTSMTFAAAQSTADMYGWYSVPVYLYAIYTGLSRISVNRHYLSDVIFGATLGSIVAHEYSVYHLKKYHIYSNTHNVSYSGENKKYVRLYPYYETRKNFGLTLVAGF